MKGYLQTFCTILVTMGIIVEFRFEADIGFLLVTAGSLAFAISTKIENRVKKKSSKWIQTNIKVNTSIQQSEYR